MFPPPLPYHTSLLPIPMPLVPLPRHGWWHSFDPCLGTKATKSPTSTVALHWATNLSSYCTGYMISSTLSIHHKPWPFCVYKKLRSPIVQHSVAVKMPSKTSRPVFFLGGGGSPTTPCTAPPPPDPTSTLKWTLEPHPPLNGDQWSKEGRRIGHSSTCRVQSGAPPLVLIWC